MAEEKQGKSIRNVGILDLRSVAEETLEGIRYIGNVGVLLTSAQTTGLAAKLNMGNVGVSIEASLEARLVNGQEIFGKESFKQRSEPLELIVNGQAIFAADIPVEDVEKALGKLWVNGQILYPENLEGVIQSKLQHLNGQAKSYAQFPRAVVGNVTLDENYLRSLDDSSEMVIVGNLQATSVLPGDLLVQKIQRLQVIGKMIVREENSEHLISCLDDKGGLTRVTTIPEGHVYVENSIVLDTDLLNALPGRKLYCTRAVQIAPDAEAEALEKNLDSLVIKGLLVCPAALKGMVSGKCDLLETKAVFYEGELWLVEDESVLRASRFDYLEGKATLVNKGELTIAPDVEPGILAGRLEKIHNVGEIFCTPEQMGAIQARLGMSGGELVDATQEKEEDEGDEAAIGNAGYLKL